MFPFSLKSLLSVPELLALRQPSKINVARSALSKVSNIKRLSYALAELMKKSELKSVFLLITAT
jgi:hypothetical protein